MKTKLSKILGIAFAFVLVASMLVFAIPVSGGAYDNLSPTLPNTWQGFPPQSGAYGNWFFDPNITQVGPIAKAINGDLYCFVAGTAATPNNPGTNDIFKSTDGGHTWTVSAVPNYFVNTAATPAGAGTVLAIVCSQQSEDVLYLTDGNYVYKSINGGQTFSILAEDSLETMLLGVCGPATVLTGGNYITCLDVGVNANGDSIVFVGVRGTFNGTIYDTTLPSVLYINEAGYPSQWTDLALHCFHSNGLTPGGYTPYSIGVAPDFATSKKIYVCASVAADAIDGNTHTYIISSVGITCSWSTVDELLFNCSPATTNHFQILLASRFAFPADYATVGEMFIGVTAWSGANTQTNGGDVYAAFDTVPPAQDALDLNVQGYTTGCIGLYNANICSLDIDANGDLIAGAYDSYQDQSPTRTYYSSDGGWTWTPSLKDPTGGNTAAYPVGKTYVQFWGDSALAGTMGCDCALSMSCGDLTGQYWNQISLISMDIEEVLDMSHAPGYLDGSSIMYVLTTDYNTCVPVQINSLLKWDGTYWYRVHDSRIYYGLGQAWTTPVYYIWVEVSPDFNDTGCLYMANTAFGVTRSVDEGCSWRTLAYPCAPLPTISAWIVVDEETVLAAGIPSGGTAEFVYKTDRHGTRPWTAVPVLLFTGAQSTYLGVDFDLSPNIGADQNVLLSDNNGHVYLNRDLAATAFKEITDVSATGVPTKFGLAEGYINTYCVFDPAYDGTADAAGYIYAAGGDLVGRCNLNLAAPLAAQTWEYISVAGATSCDPFDLRMATGIAVKGDTALYVSDAGAEAGTQEENTVSGSIDIQYYYGETAPYDVTTCDIDVNHSTFMTFTTTSGAFVNHEPLSILSWNLTCQTAHVGMLPNTVAGDIIVKGLTSGAIGIVHISEVVWGPCPECVLGQGVILLSGTLTVSVPEAATTAGDSGVWRTLNPQDALLPAPLIEWEFLDATAAGADYLIHPEADSLGVFPDDLWLTNASNMLWCLENDSNPEDSPTDMIWMFDDTLAAPVVLDAPADGALLATSTSATLSWEPLDTATLYEVMLFSYCPTCPDNLAFVDDFTTDLTCYPYTGLTPGTTYYWEVRVACDSPYVSKWSDLYSFDTALSTVPYLCSPICGASDIILSPNFSWDAVAGATSYEVQVSTDDAFANIVASGTTSTNAWVSGVTLDYSTAYYWRVRAVSDGIYSAWATCLFTTMEQPAAPPTPTPPVEVIQKNVTPTWIWVIIGIGGALTIAVVILIVTTRRVP
jgi:hypothetical protein